MNLQDYRFMTYRLVCKNIETRGSKDIIRNFNKLSSWGSKDYSGKEFFNREHDKVFISKIVNSLDSIIKASSERIQKWDMRRNEDDENYRRILGILRAEKTSREEKKDAFSEWEAGLREACEDYFTNLFYANMVLIATDHSRKRMEINDIDPFAERVDYFFYNGTKAKEREKGARDSYNLLSLYYLDNLKDLMLYTLLNIEAWERFDLEWNHRLPEILKHVNDDLFSRYRNIKKPVEFVALVDHEYPILDTRFSKYGDVKHPLDIFMRATKVEERVSMLLELIKSKKNDSENVAKYIRSIIDYEKEYSLTHSSYRTVSDNYIQEMYNAVVRNGSFSLFKIFDSIFHIKESIKEPWSSLYTWKGIKFDHIRYLLDQEVDLNLEDGILGLRIVGDPDIKYFFGYHKKSDMLNFLVNKGLRITDITMYYLFAIENRNLDVLYFLKDKGDVTEVDDFALRAALHSGSLKMSWIIYDFHEDKDYAKQTIWTMAELPESPGCTTAIKTAKQMKHEILLTEEASTDSSK